MKVEGTVMRRRIGDDASPVMALAMLKPRATKSAYMAPIRLSDENSLRGVALGSKITKRFT